MSEKPVEELCEPEKKKSVFARGETDEEKTRRLMAGGAVNMVFTLLGGALLAVWLPVMMRMLGNVNYGIFKPVFGSFFIVVCIAVLQVNLSIGVFVSNHWETDPRESKRFIITGLRLVTILGLALTALFCGGAVAANLMGRLSPVVMWIVVVYMLSVFATMLFWSVNGAINGFQRLDYVAVVNFVNPVGMLVFSALGVWLLKRAYGPDTTFTVVGAMFGVLVGAAFSVAAAVRLFKPASGGSMSLAEVVRNRSEPGMLGKIMRFGGLAAVANVGFTMLHQSSAVLVGLIAARCDWYGPELDLRLAQSGQYGAAVDFSTAAMMLLGLALAVLPAISEAHGQGRTDLMKKFYVICMKYSFLLGGLVAAIYGSMGGALANLLGGGDYPVEIMTPLVAVMGLGITALAVYFVVLHVLYAVKRPDVAAVISFVGVIIELGLVLLLSYAGRGTGPVNGVYMSVAPVAWALFGGAVFCMVASLWFIQARTPMKLPVSTLLVPAAAGLGAWALFRYAAAGFPLGARLVGCVVSYFALFILFGGFDEQDMDQMGLVGEDIPGSKKAFRRLIGASPFFGAWTGGKK